MCFLHRAELARVLPFDKKCGSALRLIEHGLRSSPDSPDTRQCLRKAGTDLHA